MQIISKPSPNYNDRASDSHIDMIIMHYTDMKTCRDAIDLLCHPESNVSSHYVISEEGEIFQLVDETKRAWHAGQGYWQGRRDINSYSLGIELANSGVQYGYHPFPEAQINSLIYLCHSIFERHSINPHYVLGHSDTAPGRKIDPGHLFPWKHLATHGIGVWPEYTPSPSLTDIDLVEALIRIGYAPSTPHDSLMAFQRHYQPHKIDGIADHETYSLINGLLTKMDPSVND